MNDRIETLILKSLIFNEPYTKKVIPFLKKEYFQDFIESQLFAKISAFILEFTAIPTKEAMAIALEKDERLEGKQVEEIKEYLENRIFPAENVSLDWLLKETEQWCKEAAIFNALRSSIGIVDDKSGKKQKGEIPKLLTDALAVSFDTNLGHDYVKDAADRYDSLHKVHERIPFDIKYLNLVTNGGLQKKTLNIILAGVNVGKSLCMCHMASAALLQGKNVVYITLEMSDSMIAQRIDANLLNISIEDLKVINKSDFLNKVNQFVLKNQKLATKHLIIKEYPTASANATHFKHFLDELNLKQDFKPDVIFIDYLNLATSSRLGHGSNVNSYTYIKSIAEEIRGLAVEYNVAVVSASQLTRSGYANTDPGMEDTAESFGLPATADFMIALVTTEELEQRGQLKIKQLKNRYGDVTRYKKFLVGVDKLKMKLFDLNDDAQEEIQNDLGGSKTPKKDTPGFDNSSFGKGMRAERSNGFDTLDYE